MVKRAILFLVLVILTSFLVSAASGDGLLAGVRACIGGVHNASVHDGLCHVDPSSRGKERSSAGDHVCPDSLLHSQLRGTGIAGSR